jgi:hypothetical protein
MSKRKIIWLGGVVIVALIAWWGYGKYQDESIFRRLQTGGEKALSGEEFQQITRILSAKYKADTYGSTTPEGTLAMFIEALKKGDADLASRYFIPEKQVEEKRRIEAGFKSGGVKTLLGILNRPHTGSLYKNGYNYSLSTFDVNGVEEYSHTFVKNSYTNIWKLESL